MLDSWTTFIAEYYVLFIWRALVR